MVKVHLEVRLLTVKVVKEVPAVILEALAALTPAAMVDSTGEGEVVLNPALTTSIAAVTVPMAVLK
tara:strand:- start:32 stop:229 length:198 start_codon:yes stop_codon:yes gene_type:complete